MGNSDQAAWDWDRTTLFTYGQALVLMAGVDITGVTPDERTSIDHMFVQLGLDEAFAATIWASAPEEGAVLAALGALTDPCARRSLLKDLLLVAHADGVYCDREAALMGRIRQALNLEEKFVTRALVWVKRGIEWQQEGLAMCLDDRD